MEKEKINWLLICSVAIVGVTIIYIINMATRMSFLEQRYHSLLTNTTSLVDRLTLSLTSLESDKVIKHLTSKVNALKNENDALRAQIKDSGRELTSIAQKEKKCQDKLSQLSGKRKKGSNQDEEDRAPQAAVSGNRGFLLKDGKPIK